MFFFSDAYTTSVRVKCQISIRLLLVLIKSTARFTKRWYFKNKSGHGEKPALLLCITIILIYTSYIICFLRLYTYYVTITFMYYLNLHFMYHFLHFYIFVHGICIFYYCIFVRLSIHLSIYIYFYICT